MVNGFDNDRKPSQADVDLAATVVKRMQTQGPIFPGFPDGPVLQNRGVFCALEVLVNDQRLASLRTLMDDLLASYMTELHAHALMEDAAITAVTHLYDTPGTDFISTDLELALDAINGLPAGSWSGGGESGPPYDAATRTGMYDHD